MHNTSWPSTPAPVANYALMLVAPAVGSVGLAAGLAAWVYEVGEGKRLGVKSQAVGRMGWLRLQRQPAQLHASSLPTTFCLPTSLPNSVPHKPKASQAPAWAPPAFGQPSWPWQRQECAQRERGRHSTGAAWRSTGSSWHACHHTGLNQQRKSLGPASPDWPSHFALASSHATHHACNYHPKRN